MWRCAVNVGLAHQRKPEKTGGTGRRLRQGGVRDEIRAQQGLSQQQALKSKAQRNHYMVLHHWKHKEFLKIQLQSTKWTGAEHNWRTDWEDQEERIPHSSWKGCAQPGLKRISDGWDGRCGYILRYAERINISGTCDLWVKDSKVNTGMHRVFMGPLGMGQLSWQNIICFLSSILIRLIDLVRTRSKRPL